MYISRLTKTSQYCKYKLFYFLLYILCLYKHLIAWSSGKGAQIKYGSHVVIRTVIQRNMET